MSVQEVTKMRLSDSEKKDLDKFIKFLALKAAQIVVQSRTGEKLSTPCEPSYHKVDMFNLNIQDLPDVLANAKKLLMYETITENNPFYIEISLETSEGDSMVLEYWCLGINSEKCDATERILSTIYGRIGILLKSLVSITRVTPAYKLSRRQGHESYIMCYKVHFGQPPIKNLGEGAKNKTIAQVCTPVGTIHLNVSYRTQMTISPSHAKDNSIMVKSDHFDSRDNIRNSSHENNDGKHPIIIGAFADKKHAVVEQPTIQEPALFTRFRRMSEARQKEQKERREKQEKEEQEKQKLKEQKQEKEKEKSGTEAQTLSLHALSVCDDFVLVDLKTPFASNDKYSEIQDFRKKMKQVPEQLYKDASSTSSESITQLLQECEEDIDKYDQVYKSLRESPDNA